jgi:hypothetical protein
MAAADFAFDGGTSTTVSLVRMVFRIEEGHRALDRHAHPIAVDIEVDRAPAFLVGRIVAAFVDRRIRGVLRPSR